jgi:hypothetical protein
MQLITQEHDQVLTDLETQRQAHITEIDRRSQEVAASSQEHARTAYETLVGTMEKMSEGLRNAGQQITEGVQSLAQEASNQLTTLASTQANSLATQTNAVANNIDPIWSSKQTQLMAEYQAYLSQEQARKASEQSNQGGNS